MTQSSNVNENINSNEIDGDVGNETQFTELSNEEGINKYFYVCLSFFKNSLIYYLLRLIKISRDIGLRY